MAAMLTPKIMEKSWGRNHLAWQYGTDGNSEQRVGESWIGPIDVRATRGRRLLSPWPVAKSELGAFFGLLGSRHMRVFYSGSSLDWVPLAPEEQQQ